MSTRRHQKGVVILIHLSHFVVNCFFFLLLLLLVVAIIEVREPIQPLEVTGELIKHILGKTPSRLSLSSIRNM
jgi:hypothetical protein